MKKSKGGQVKIHTHGNGDRVKIPLLPNNVGKKSVDSGQGHENFYLRGHSKHFSFIWFLKII